MHYNANMGGGGDHINLTGKYTTHGSKTGDILQPPTPSLSQHVHPCFQCQDSPSLSALLRLLLTMNVQYVTQKFPVIQVSLRGRWPHIPLSPSSCAFGDFCIKHIRAGCFLQNNGLVFWVHYFVG